MSLLTPIQRYQMLKALGDPEITNEICDNIDSKVDSESPTFTGTVTIDGTLSTTGETTLESLSVTGTVLVQDFEVLGAAYADAGLTVYGDTRVNGQGFSAQYDAAIVANVADVDWTNGNTQTLDLSGATGMSAVTVNFTSIQSGAVYTLVLTQGPDATAVTFTGVLWPAGDAPVITTTDNAVDIVSFIAIGGVLYGTFSQDFS